MTKLPMKKNYAKGKASTGNKPTHTHPGGSPKTDPSPFSKGQIGASAATGRKRSSQLKMAVKRVLGQG